MVVFKRDDSLIAKTLAELTKTCGASTGLWKPTNYVNLLIGTHHLTPPSSPCSSVCVFALTVFTYSILVLKFAGLVVCKTL